ncbi:MAG TPA: S-methyl-5-thioribose-1-phosphate isomerase, partial [Bacteroidales bacterium]|nr:S-methyl-5-thioribose-1-phosphate isomerase [Bacteroidales bacterium]
MKYKNINYQTVDFSPETNTVLLIEQNLLPFEFKIVESKTCEETCLHIEKMTVRGAGAIGGAAALAMAQAAVEATPVNYLASIATAKKRIESTRPTAQNLFAATNFVYRAALISKEKAVEAAIDFCNADAEACKQIGLFGNELIPEKANIETH